MGVVIPESFALGQIIVRRSGRAAPYVSTIGLSSGVLTDPQDFADGLDDAVTADGSLFPASDPGQWSSAYSYEGVAVTYMLASGPVNTTSGTPALGENVLAPAPPNVSLLVSKSTPFGGRQSRGRMFLPPVWIAESNIDAGGTIAAGPVAAMQSRLTAFMNALDTAELTPVLLHGTEATLPYEITSLTLQSLVATQRRRLR